jgi:uncharacterized membrane protein HdeD (DUF308 family)
MADSVVRNDILGFGTWSAHWWDFLIRGAAGIVFGLILFFMPGISLLTFIMLFTIFALVVGIILLLQAVAIKDGRWWVRVIEGVIGIAAAAAVVVSPGLTLLTFAYIIAFYWIFTGVLDIIVAVEAHKRIHGEWLLIAGGLLSLIVGIIVLAHPLVGIIALAQVIGVFSVALGLLLVILAIKLKLTGSGTPSPSA